MAGRDDPIAPEKERRIKMFGMGSNDNDIEAFAEDVKRQGEATGPDPFGKDLQFDPTTGQFRQVSKFGGRGDGDIVTEMTSKGFA